MRILVLARDVDLDALAELADHLAVRRGRPAHVGGAVGLRRADGRLFDARHHLELCIVLQIDDIVAHVPCLIAVVDAQPVPDIAALVLEHLMDADGLSLFHGAQHRAVHALADIRVAVGFAGSDHVLCRRLKSVLCLRFVRLRRDSLAGCRFGLRRVGRLGELVLQIDHIIAHPAGHRLVVNCQVIPDLAALVEQGFVNRDGFALLHGLLHLAVRGGAGTQVCAAVHLALADFRQRRRRRLRRAGRRECRGR